MECKYDMAASVKRHYSIEAVSSTRAISLKTFLKDKITKYQDMNSEALSIDKSLRADSKVFDLVSYTFDSQDDALARDSAVKATIQQLYEEWLQAEDAAFFAMTESELDERSCRLSRKTLNGIVDDEVIDADARSLRNLQLLCGRSGALAIKKMYDLYFGERSY